MFAPRNISRPHSDVVPCLAWCESVLTDAVRQEAATVLREAEKAVPPLAAWRTTPQSAPWHCEGPFLADHLSRMLGVLFAIRDGASLTAIEEFAREKDIVPDIAHLERTVRGAVPLLTAFTFVHDVAKPDVALFDAAQESKGAGEGLFAHGARAQEAMTDAERMRYGKLVRAYCVRHPMQSPQEAAAGFFAEYGIEVHYPKHDTRAAGPAYAALRDAVLRHVGVSSSHAKLLAELIRYHIDVIRMCAHAPECTAYAFFAAQYGKLGLNVDVALDMLVAVLFLDAVAGSVVVGKDGRLGAQASLVVQCFRIERDAMPQRAAARARDTQYERKRAQKAVLAAVGLDGDAVFALLGVPIGPERGDIMRKVWEALEDPTIPLAFGSHTEEMRRRMTRAREKLEML